MVRVDIDILLSDCRQQLVSCIAHVINKLSQNRLLSYTNHRIYMRRAGYAIILLLGICWWHLVSPNIDIRYKHTQIGKLDKPSIKNSHTHTRAHG